MSELPIEQKADWMRRLALGLAFILVCMGMANNLPNIPGLLGAVQSIPGLGELPRLSKYNSEFFFPLSFAFMTVIALLTSSFARDWRDQGFLKHLSGIALDLLMLAIIIGVAIVYLIENVGYVSFIEEKDFKNSYLINDLEISENNQGKGYGKELLLFAQDKIKKLNGKRVKVFVFEDNPALEFYKKFGYEVNEEVKRTNTLVLVKDL